MYMLIEKKERKKVLFVVTHSRGECKHVYTTSIYIVNSSSFLGAFSLLVTSPADI
jgi:hypothetical protein